MLIYALGGGATLLTSPYFGRLADRHGKLKIFTWLVLISAVPTLVIANMVPSPVWFILLVTTSYMVFTSGRFVPAMAMITASVEPRYRGGFMSVNSAIQQLAAGLATSVAALLVNSDAQGRIAGYPRAGWLALIMIVASVWLIRHLRVGETAPTDPSPAVEPAEVG